MTSPAPAAPQVPTGAHHRHDVGDRTKTTKPIRPGPGRSSRGSAPAGSTPGCPSSELRQSARMTWSRHAVRAASLSGLRLTRAISGARGPPLTAADGRTCTCRDREPDRGFRPHRSRAESGSRRGRLSDRRAAPPRAELFEPVGLEQREMELQRVDRLHRRAGATGARHGATSTARRRGRPQPPAARALRASCPTNMRVALRAPGPVRPALVVDAVADDDAIGQRRARRRTPGTSPGPTRDGPRIADTAAAGRTRAGPLSGPTTSLSGPSGMTGRHVHCLLFGWLSSQLAGADRAWPSACRDVDCDRCSSIASVGSAARTAPSGTPCRRISLGRIDCATASS